MMTMMINLQLILTHPVLTAAANFTGPIYAASNDTPSSLLYPHAVEGL